MIEWLLAAGGVAILLQSIWIARLNWQLRDMQAQIESIRVWTYWMQCAVTQLHGHRNPHTYDGSCEKVP